ncbi:MAG: EF-P beta-lysylation protein EpmB [Pseudomonadales bacterium]|nr:EF-P beta-lysylation protein EpmB [Pseudomonadales bacterium]
MRDHSRRSLTPLPDSKPPIIPLSTHCWHGPSWQQLLREAPLSLPELARRLKLDPAQLAGDAAARQFTLRVPAPYLARIEPGNPDDPLLRQVLPVAEELLARPGFTSDPLDEAHHSPLPGVLHKYRSRLLIVTTGACAVHCRYCFRRHFPYQAHQQGRTGQQAVLEYLAHHPEISEVILSGGDPLSLSDTVLERWIEQLARLPQLLRLRLHSRLPVVIPQRITAELLDILTGSRLTTVMVLHSNHPNEIDGDVVSAAQRMRAAGITLLNQSVLLRGVNDDAGTLAELSEKLFVAGILPYYLHLLDPVAGAAHFAVPEPEARQIHQSLLARVSGYLAPRLVVEVPGERSKRPLGS